MADNKQRDWLQILVAPLLIGLIGTALAAWFTWQQNQQQNSVEERRAESAQEIEEQRTQDTVLQEYLDQMGTLLLHEDLRTSEVNSDVAMLARARTLTALTRLDSDRRFNVMQFLIETNLVQGNDGEAPAVSLAGSRLSDMRIAFASLSGTDLRRADLSRTDLTRTDLSNALLFDAILTHANLTGANLTGADLTDADLTNANLTGANLTSAALSDVDLSGADLSDAKGFTNMLLEDQAASLEGATMPDGSKHP
jgi:uncharacterized protein YjbI with pentapeptide repeats